MIPGAASTPCSWAAGWHVCLHVGYGKHGLMVRSGKLPGSYLGASCLHIAKYSHILMHEMITYKPMGSPETPTSCRAESFMLFPGFCSIHHWIICERLSICELDVLYRHSSLFLLIRLSLNEP